MRLSADEPYPRTPGMTGAARAARRLQTNRSAKQAQRARERAAGRIDREGLDRALVDALREHLAVDDRSLSRPIDARVVLSIAHQRILERGERDGLRLDRRALMTALGDRVLKAARPRPGC